MGGGREDKGKTKQNQKGGAMTHLNILNYIVVRLGELLRKAYIIMYVAVAHAHCSCAHIKNLNFEEDVRAPHAREARKL